MGQGRFEVEGLERRALMSSSISGVVFYDANANGRQEATEGGTGAVRVFLDSNNNGAIDSGEAVAVTDSSGRYSFGQLSAGAYLVRVSPGAGVDETNVPAVYGQSITVGNDSAKTAKGIAIRYRYAPWGGVGGDAYHTGQSPVGTQELTRIHWRGVVDKGADASTAGRQYGSVVVTQLNTVIVPVRMANGTYALEAQNGGTGKLLWKYVTDYVAGAGGAGTFSAALTAGGRLYFAGAGGVVYYIDRPDLAGAPKTVKRVVYFGEKYFTAKDKGKYVKSVFVNTPITTDRWGDVYFGVRVVGDNPLHLRGGLVRVDDKSGKVRGGVATVVTGNKGVTMVVNDSAPAVSQDGDRVYAVMTGVAGDAGTYLACMDAVSLKVINVVKLVDPSTGQPVSVVGGAAVTVAPDGDVYLGVTESPAGTNDERGWLLHWSWDMKTVKAAGAAGAGVTASIVPASAVPSYTGTSTYLVMGQANDPVGSGGSGVNRLVILDPFATQVDAVTGEDVMKEVIAIAGRTVDGVVAGAVKEWNVSSAVVDVGRGSVIATSEDGKVYRWDLTANKFTEIFVMGGGTTGDEPLSVGVDGTVYAVSGGVVFGIGK